LPSTWALEATSGWSCTRQSSNAKPMEAMHYSLVTNKRMRERGCGPELNRRALIYCVCIALPSRWILKSIVGLKCLVEISKSSILAHTGRHVAHRCVDREMKTLYVSFFKCQRWVTPLASIVTPPDPSPSLWQSQCSTQNDFYVINYTAIHIIFSLYEE